MIDADYGIRMHNYRTDELDYNVLLDCKAL